jgi:phosphoribosylanthranilate isomerase
MPQDSPPRLQRLTPPVIQVAGALSLQEARLAARAGATHLGLPLRLDVHQPDLDDDSARRLAANRPPELIPVLITYQRDPAAAARLCASLGAPVVQLHGEASPAELAELRRIAPQLTIIKSLVVRPGGLNDLEQRLRKLADFADAFITDTFDPATGATGATGLTHDWSVSRRLAQLSPRPVILAGGLNPDNVAEAVRTVRPAGVDAHTGLENPDGSKNFEKMRQFARRARQAWRDLERRPG